MLYDFWKLLAGVAVFMLGMQFLAGGLRALTSREVKLFLRKQTLRPWTAIASGALITGLVQSSSIVNLIVLGLVGSGTIPIANALAVTLGTNIGSTFNTWIIASLGFSMAIEKLAIPIVGLAGILRTMFREKSTLYNWLNILLGFGFLFYGLDMMRIGMGDAIRVLNIKSFGGFPIFIYPMIGLAITALTQSSAATVAIVLSALNATAIDLTIATAIVLGSEVGTTLKLLIAAIGKEPSMKRVAVGNLIFNTVTTIIIFIILKPVNYFIVSILGINDPLIALASFQTLTNLTAVVLFFPLLGSMSRFLSKRFNGSEQQSLYIGKVPVENEELAIAALEKETLYFLKTIILYFLNVFDKEDQKEFDEEIPEKFSRLGSAGRYLFIKQLHGYMYAYVIALQKVGVDRQQAEQLSRLIAASRNGMYAAKSIKDAEADIDQLRNSGNDIKYRFYLESREAASLLLEQLALQLQPAFSKQKMFPGLVEVYRKISTSYNDRLQVFYSKGPLAELSDIEVSTIINLNREVYSAFKSLVFALKDGQLTGDEARYFEELPGFIR